MILRTGLVLLITASFTVSACTSRDETSPKEDVTNHGETIIQFEDVTLGAGLTAFRHETGAFGKRWMPEWMGSGGGFIDYDGDGWLDILLVGGGSWQGQSTPEARTLWLFRNNGDGRFSDQTMSAGLADVRTYGFGVAVADYDNDGDQDFFLSTLYTKMLFRNDGGKFTEVGRAAGLANQSEWSSSAIFFDADRDGWVDLYVGNYVDWSPDRDVWCSLDGVNKSYCTPELYEGVPGRFFRNDGDGTFSDRTAEAGFLPAPGKTLGVAELDFNSDGWPDLVVANDTQRDLLYKNNGDGKFTEQGMLSGIAFDENGRARAGMGIDAGDIHNDGHATIFVGNFSKETIGVYKYLGDDLFIDCAATSQIGIPSLLTLTFGLFLFDVDLDGYLDLFAANGHMQPDIERVQHGVTYRQPSQLFINQKDGTFREVNQRSGSVLAKPLLVRGAAYADYDNDGDLDILLIENGGPVHLWRNESTGAQSLRVQLQGQESNSDALGARIVAVVGQERIERRIRTGSSYLSQSEKIATFGLGTATSVDSLLIYWPSGRMDVFQNVASNQMLRIVEGSVVPSTSALGPISIRDE